MSEEILNDKLPEEKPKLLGMIMHPTEQFLKLKKTPVIWVPLIIISLLMMIGTTVTTLNMDYANDPNIQHSIEVLGIDEGLIIMSSAILLGLMSLFIPGLTALVSTLIYLVVAMVIKKPVSFSQLYSMNVYILFISALSALFNALLSFVFTGDSITMFTSLGAIIQTENILVQNALSMIEIFTIWGLILTVIGLQNVANFTKRSAMIIVIGFFVLSLLFSVFSGWISTLF